ncbi:MAG: AAA family ATPase [Halobacteriaceae archaeon]
MEPPLWTERHQPALAELPQPAVRHALERGVAEPVNLILHGPTGVGKTAAARAVATAAQTDPDSDFTVINVADFFDRTKKEIRNDPRFAEFLQGEIPWVKSLSSSAKDGLSKRYKSDWSKAEMVAHVLKEYAGYAPTAGQTKTLLLDNAEAARADFQQSLRRVMERHHETTRFIIATRQPSGLIPAIRSRCFSVPVRRPTIEETVTVLEGICEAESVTYETAGLEYVAGFADGNLREAILAAQATAIEAEAITRTAAYEALSTVGHGETVAEMLSTATDGDFQAARKTLDELLYDQGLSGEEVLDEVVTVAQSRWDGEQLARLHVLAADVDHDLTVGTNPRVPLAGLLAELAAGENALDVAGTS